MQQDKRIDRIILGNLVLDGIAIRPFLKKGNYFVTYDPESETMQFGVNPFRGGVEVFLENRQVSYESAAKFAGQLGLKGEGGINPLSWRCWSPYVVVRDDGSEAAETLVTEVQKLRIPFSTEKWKALELQTGTGRYTVEGGWPLEKMLGIVREMAKRYQEQLAATP